MMVKTGSSYLSQSELPLTFGLGTAAAVTKIDVKWPDGSTDTLPGAAAGQTITIEQGRGIITWTHAVRLSSEGRCPSDSTLHADD